jgi:PAS domain S-box-containing protein
MTRLSRHLESQQPFLNRFFNVIQDGVFALDQHLAFVRVNRWMEEHFRSQMPLVGKKCHHVFHHLENSIPECINLAPADPGRVHVELLPYPSARTPTEWFEISMSRLEDDDGKVIGVIGHVKDVSARKQAQALLTDEANWLRVLVEQSRDGIVVLDENGKVVESNQQFAHMAGYGLEEIHSLHVWDWDTQWDKEQLLGMLQSVDDAGAHFETRHRRKDGTLYDVEISTNGAVYRGQKLVFCVCRDITERIVEQKRIEKALLLTQFSFDKAAIGILRTGDDERILDANEHVCRNLGYNHRELCRMRIHDIDSSLSVEDRQLLWQSLREDGTIDYETVYRRKDGTAVPVDVTANLLEFEGDSYCLHFARDITDQKNDEKQKLLMETHLRQTQRMEALGTLAGGIAHDFNNILSVISGYAELAQLRCPVNSKLRHYIDEIHMAGVRAKTLVDQILTFSRKGKSEKRHVDIAGILAETLNLVRATLPSTIEIRQHIKTETGSLFADETQMRQVIMNLCTNAYHSMHKEGGLLEVDLAPVAIGIYDSSVYPVIRPGKYLKLVVADTGQGMDADVLARIFDPYFTTRKSGESTGMGLSTVHGIVKDHGGSIKVYSRPGVGTTFQVFFPFVETPARHSAVQTGIFSSGSGYILLVDDEKQLVEIGDEMLEGLGYLVETRSNPIDAIDAFRMNPDKYDLVITDMTMPRMTGERLAKEIKSIRPDMPIILCTGFSANLGTDTLTEIGINEMLMKPVTLNNLASAVRKVLGDQVPRTS